MIGDPLVANGARDDEEAPNRDSLGQDAGPSTGDELATPAGDRILQDAGGKRRADPRVDQCESPPMMLDLIEMMHSILPAVAGVDPCVALLDDLLDHLLEETDDTVLGHIQSPIDDRGFDQGLERGIELEDGSG